MLYSVYMLMYSPTTSNTEGRTWRQLKISKYRRFTLGLTAVSEHERLLSCLPSHSAHSFVFSKKG